MKKNTDFVNLDADAGADLWDMEEVAKAMVGDVYARYALRSKLYKFMKDDAIETPKPAMVFRGTPYWAATDETTAAWQAVIDTEREKAENKAYSKREMLAVLKKNIDASPGYYRTKVANREKAAELSAILNFIQNLGDVRIESDTVNDIEKAIKQYEARG